MVARGKGISARIWLAIQEEIASYANATLGRETVLFGLVAWAAMLLA
jgi:hypothetical protein